MLVQVNRRLHSSIVSGAGVKDLNGLAVIVGDLGEVDFGRHRGLWYERASGTVQHLTAQGVLMLLIVDTCCYAPACGFC